MAIILLIESIKKKKKMPHEAHEHFVPLNSILFNGL